MNILLTPSAQTTSNTLEQKLQETTSQWDRLPILIELATSQNHGNHDFAHQCAVEALNLAKALNDRFWIACSQAALGINLMSTSRYTEILYYLEQASEAFDQLSDPRMKAATDFRIAQVYINTRRLTEAQSLLENTLNTFQVMGEPDWIARIHGLLGDIYSKRGEHAQAIERYHQAIDIFTELNREVDIAKIYQQLASMYRKLEDPENHQSYLFKALASYRKHGNKSGTAVTVANIAAMYIDRLQFTQAEPYIRESLHLYQELGYVSHTALTWSKMSLLHRVKGDFAEAFRCQRIGMALCKQSEDKLALGKLYETLGVLCYKSGRPHHCRKYFLKALPILEEHGDMFYLHQIHRLLGHIYEELGEHQKSLHHYKEFARIREEYAGLQKCFEASHAEREIKVRKLQRQQEEELSRNAKLKEMIREKETQLIALTLEIVRNQESRLKAGEENGNAPHDRHDSHDTFRTDNWEAFAQQFHRVHQNFYPNLLQRFPALTPTEAKVCSLIRTGLSSKEIAGVLCISKRTVDNHRVHIHKKMRIPYGTSLANFITAM